MKATNCSSPARTRCVWAFALLILHGLLGWKSITAHSNVYDELPVAVSGAAFLRTHHWIVDRVVYPPLQKILMGAAAESARPEKLCQNPGSRMKECYTCGYEYFYRNSVSPEQLLSRARLASLLQSLLLAICLFLWMQSWYGPVSALGALSLYVSAPIVLTQASVATVDMGFAACFFIALYAYRRYLENPSFKSIMLTGAFAAATLLSKTPGVLLIPIALVFTFTLLSDRQRAIKRFGLFCLSSALWLVGIAFLVYGKDSPALFLESLRQMVIYAQSGNPVYFHGQIKTGGWWYFYGAGILLKSAPGFVILVGVGLLRKHHDRRFYALLIPAVILLLVFSLSSKQQGTRYILGAIPFLCMIGGTVVGGLERAFTRYAAAALCVFSLLESVWISPHFLSYFSPIVGGAYSGYRWLVDSDLDWGQDFPQLRHFWESKQRPALILALMGNGDRPHYLGPQQDLFGNRLGPQDAYFQYLHPVKMKHEILLISANVLQAAEGGTADWDWLRTRTPTDRPTPATFAYDISSDAEAAFHIGQIYLANQQFDFAIRQFERSIWLSDKSLGARIALADAYRLAGNRIRSIQIYRQILALKSCPPEARQYIHSQIALMTL